MSLAPAVVVGTLVGGVAALGIYVSTGPDDMGRAAVPAPPTFGPVPTPTVTRLADCTPPAVLKKGVCVTTRPGPRVVVTAPTVRTTAPRPAPAPAPPVTDDRDDDDDEHEDDEEHEDEHDDEDEHDEEDDD